MPFANLKVPAGSLNNEHKKLLIDRTTDLFAEVYGEEARRNTLVLVDEVVDGGWGIGGNVLTLSMLQGDDSPPPGRSGTTANSTEQD